MGTYEVSAKTVFSAAHRIIGHKGACKEIHGHNWSVEAVFGASKLDKLGMVMDFYDVKAEMDRLAGLFDHKTINDVPQFGGVNPTAENIAAFFFKNLKKALKVKPRIVKVFETEDTWAGYRED
jgi:6-pyruvoyltetrahydropterin/6-carboxytetrahydropterin synthase